MRILALSDIHYSKLDLELRGFDYIFVLGDYGNNYDKLLVYNAYIVRGNCDLSGIKEKEIKIMNKKILLTHGDLYDVKYNLNRIYYMGIEKNYDLIFFGHTHNQEYIDYDDIKLINPGAYQKKEYAIIEDDILYFYKNNVIIEKYELKW